MGNISTNGTITADEFIGDLSGTASQSNYLVPQNMSNKNLNDLTTAGLYYGYTGMVNAPEQAIAVMEVLVYSYDWIIQRFTQIANTRAGCIWERRKYNGTTWSDWMRFEPSRYGNTLPTSNLYVGMTYFLIQ